MNVVTSGANNRARQTHRTDPGTVASNPAGGQDFLGLFCEKFRCSPRKFKKRVFLECVYPHGALAARFIRLVNPRLFKADFALIEKIATAASFEEVRRVVDHHGAQNAPEGLVRLVLRVRLSKQRTLELAQSLFQKDS